MLLNSFAALLLKESSYWLPTLRITICVDYWSRTHFMLQLESSKSRTVLQFFKVEWATSSNCLWGVNGLANRPVKCRSDYLLELWNARAPTKNLYRVRRDLLSVSQCPYVQQKIVYLLEYRKTQLFELLPGNCRLKVLFAQLFVNAILAIRRQYHSSLAGDLH